MDRLCPTPWGLLVAHRNRRGRARGTCNSDRVKPQGTPYRRQVHGTEDDGAVPTMPGHHRNNALNEVPGQTSGSSIPSAVLYTGAHQGAHKVPGHTVLPSSSESQEKAQLVGPLGSVENYSLLICGKNIHIWSSKVRCGQMEFAFP